MDRRGFLRALAAGGALSLAGCLGGSGDGEPPLADESLTVATATTVHDSGLLAELAAGFEDEFGASLRPVVRGTGAALRTARDGDCDAVLVHAPPLEAEFVAAGHGVNRRAVMVNDFLVVGPPDDPAEAAGSDPLAAFRAIAAGDAAFRSRG
ncbi:substrate-binding domain-containing protein, partial [Halobacterium sp. CBA1126]|uniref:substrate-binding domain-containing protein n=1 Tax=Halobacterium sp. CBA1126 TaxID=2668074 RepID=UPI00132857C5